MRHRAGALNILREQPPQVPLPPPAAAAATARFLAAVPAVLPATDGGGACGV
ncbi:MAG: hypothetical protein LBE17_09050 [Treponema sp.]|nr:hypothetical protein [Treponema sp.]